MTTNVLSDIGGVIFTFDKEKRKRIWVEEAGQDALDDMLIDPEVTATLEEIQGRRIAELEAEEMPGSRALIDYVNTVGEFRGYSTGAGSMADQFLAYLGFDSMIGKVRHTYPGHVGKQKSVDQILEEVERMGEVAAFIDDNENEVAVWADAAHLVSGKRPTVYLFKQEAEDSGAIDTERGEIVVVKSLGEIQRSLQSQEYAHALRSKRTEYKIDFTKSDNRFGG